jgi:hypothetical protein
MKTHRTLLSFAVFALLSAPAVAQKMTGPHPAPEIPAPQLLETTGLFLQRFAKVGDDLFITGQPTQEGLRELKKRGVTNRYVSQFAHRYQLTGIGSRRVVDSSQLERSHSLPPRFSVQCGFNERSCSRPRLR